MEDGQVHEDRTLICIEGNPRSSVRGNQAVEQAMRTKVGPIMRGQLLCPHHLQRVQAPSPLDFRPRQEFFSGSFDNMMKIPSFAATLSAPNKQNPRGATCKISITCT
jgi:hypothetical protein